MSDSYKYKQEARSAQQEAQSALEMVISLLDNAELLIENLVHDRDALMEENKGLSERTNDCGHSYQAGYVRGYQSGYESGVSDAEHGGDSELLVTVQSLNHELDVQRDRTELAWEQGFEEGTDFQAGMGPVSGDEKVYPANPWKVVRR